jgi:hypothetical protein
MYLCGLGDPLLSSAAAFLLNYIPILGSLFGTVIFLLAGMGASIAYGGLCCRQRSISESTAEP